MNKFLIRALSERLLLKWFTTVTRYEKLGITDDEEPHDDDEEPDDDEEE